jgi:hypothetical protein
MRMIALLNVGSKLTDHAQVRELGVERSPTQSGKLDVAVVHLARSRVQDLSKNKEEEKRCQVQQLHRRRNETEEDEVGNVEVRGFWQILGQKIHCR